MIGPLRGELLRLRWDQVDLQTGVITIHHTKSGRIRHVPMNDLVRRVLRSRSGSEGPVFRFLGDPVNDLKNSFRGAIRRAGIPPCRFHDLRHTFATRLAMGGIDLPTVKELLGHASITTTMKYAHPTPEHRKSAVDILVVEKTSRLLADGDFGVVGAGPQVVEKYGADERTRTALRPTHYECADWVFGKLLKDS